MQTSRDTTAETPRTWIGVAIAAHMFDRPVARIRVPSAALAEEHPAAGHAAGPAWPAFRGAARPKHPRYLSFADRDHLLRYVRARAEIGS
jgi:hypothetical protein